MRRPAQWAQDALDNHQRGEQPDRNKQQELCERIPRCLRRFPPCAHSLKNPELLSPPHCLTWERDWE
jgi:hypothetical protein